MSESIAIENIEEKRRAYGIEDDELRVQIRSLRVGDLVMLTFLGPAAGAPTFETLPVRITRIKQGTFCGKLAQKPLAARLARLQTGSAVRFTSVHIHSLFHG